MASQRRQNVIAFPNSNLNFANSRLATVRCKMLRAPLSSNSARWPNISVKAKALAEQQPSAAALLEELLDDLLAEVP